MARTDTERLDAMDAAMGGQFNGSRYGVVCRWSTHGHGWKMHETSQNNAPATVRQAIDRFLDANEDKRTEVENGNR